MPQGSAQDTTLCLVNLLIKICSFACVCVHMCECRFRSRKDEWLPHRDVGEVEGEVAMVLDPESPGLVPWTLGVI